MSRDMFFDYFTRLTLHVKSFLIKKIYFSEKLSDSSGQASLLVAMMILTFLLLFQFVINVGLLVNAKINLQNAADLAAYAGASVQARQLNHISFLNYEMRRQYKKFLFRYYVIGNMAQKTHPGTGESRLWSPDGSTNYGVPAVCVIFNKDDNNCQLAELPSLPKINANPFDSISIALQQQYKELEQIKRVNCKRLGILNMNLLIYWLYNTDPDLQVIKQSLGSVQVGGTPNDTYARVLKTLEGLASGLGLVPKEILLHERIKTLESYVNFAPQRAMNIDRLRELQQSGDINQHERSIQAFLSAWNTLGAGEGGGHTFDNSESIIMDEMMPGDATQAKILRLNSIKETFETYYVDFPQEGDKGCKGHPLPIRATEVPLGVYKDPTILTYYAVRLKAKARLLFSPFGDVELKAYSAAQPFGSRIGPRPSDSGSDFIRAGAKPGFLPNCGATDCEGVPNLPVLEGDNAGKGWNNPLVIASMFNTFRDEGGQVLQYIGPEQMEKAYRTVMAPNPWEQSKYNIPNDLGEIPEDPTHTATGDPYNNFFNDDLNYRFFAPIIPPNRSPEETEYLITDLIRQNIIDRDLQNALSNGMKAYLSRLSGGEGEGGESMNVASLSDPLRVKDPATGQIKIVQLPNTVLMSSADQIRSSWSGLKRSDYEERRRLGYSVNFVSFDTLINKNGATSDESQTWSNTPHSDAEAEADLPFLKH